MENDRLTYTVQEVAKLLGINHKGVYTAIAENSFPHVKVGRRILIPRRAFDCWLGSAENNGSTRARQA